RSFSFDYERNYNTDLLSMPLNRKRVPLRRNSHAAAIGNGVPFRRNLHNRELELPRKVCKALWLVSGKKKELFDEEIWPTES
ncbi:MAG: hypothetical protein J5649_08055, partial [Lachnospiraceae bacterium]|nr:hypothetical protein [Lachnospiraceae bacterium]